MLYMKLANEVRINLGLVQAFYIKKVQEEDEEDQKEYFNLIALYTDGNEFNVLPDFPIMPHGYSYDLVLEVLNEIDSIIHHRERGVVDIEEIQKRARTNLKLSH